MTRILERNKYFIIGDKGTGKTAYPVYLQNHNVQDIVANKKRYAKVVNMKDTDYRRFIKLRTSNNLEYSDYCDIWKLILLMLLADDLKNNENRTIFNSKKFAVIKKVIDDYYLEAYTPEIASSMQFVEGYKQNVNALIKAQQAEAGANKSSSHQ